MAEYAESVQLWCVRVHAHESQAVPMAHLPIHAAHLHRTRDAFGKVGVGSSRAGGGDCGSHHRGVHLASDSTSRASESHRGIASVFTCFGVRRFSCLDETVSAATKRHLGADAATSIK